MKITTENVVQISDIKVGDILHCDGEYFGIKKITESWDDDEERNLKSFEVNRVDDFIDLEDETYNLDMWEEEDFQCEIDCSNLYKLIFGSWKQRITG